MKQKTNDDQIDLKRVIMVHAAELSARIMQLSNQGLLTYTPTQLLPVDNPDLCNLVWEGIIRILTVDLLLRDSRYKNRNEQLKSQVYTILAEGGDEQKVRELLNQVIETESAAVGVENLDLIKREAERRLAEALEFIKDKYKIRFEWMISVLVLDAIISVSPIPFSPHMVRILHAFGDWIAKEDLNLPEKESGGTKPDYDLINLPDHYPNLLKVWHSAKQDAKKAQKDPLLKENWRKRIQGSYEYDLPDDLIEWLNVNIQERQAKLMARSDLEHLTNKLKAGYMLIAPSDIAVEHSARLCGIPPYYYSISHLQRMLREKKGLWFKSAF